MTFATLIADALESGSFVALVGADAPSIDLVESISEDLHRRTVRIDAMALIDAEVSDLPPRGSKGGWVLIVENCEKVPATGTAEAADREPEDLLLDLAFDGDPTLPDDCVVMLCFAGPTSLSDALAEDEIPCTVLSPDMVVETVPSRTEVMAKALGVPVVTVQMSKTDAKDLIGLPEAA
jgi:hypothetical protein